MKDTLLKVHEYLGQIPAARAERQKAIAELESWVARYRKYPEDFSQEIANADKKIKEIRQQEAAHNTEIYDTLAKLRAELVEQISQQVKAPMDLGDDKSQTVLQRALKFTESSDLDLATASNFAQQLRGNQAALRMLREKYKSKGIPSNIDELILDPGRFERAFTDQLGRVVYQGGAPETFQDFLYKFGATHGIDLPKVDTSDVMTAAMERAAGLSPQ